MADASAALQGGRGTGRQRGFVDGLTRFARYALLRAAGILVTVVIGVYVSILIANMGGYVDQIRIGQIREGVALATSFDPEMRMLTSAQRQAQIEAQVQLQIERFGLDRPFLLRSWNYLTSALTLELGRSESLYSDSGSRVVRNIILERLAPTLILQTTANLILFFTALFVGLVLSRQYGSIFDRVVIALAPTSAAPAWFFGIFLILIFAAVLRVLPFGGMVASPPPADTLAYALSVMKHLILPVTATVISAVFLSTYNWRTFFLIYSSEDYVEMAKAKGLSARAIERRYVLRPTLPNIITSFAFIVITLWQGAIILETVFNWPGLGRLLFQAVTSFDTPIIIASVVIFAYLLAVTVFLLDIVYALVDPRVKLDGGGRS